MAAIAAATITGSLTDRVAIQQNTTTPDSQGGRSSSWGTLATVWASVRAARATELLQAQAIESQVDYAVTMRYRQDVVPAMRLSWTPYGGSAKTLQIHGIHPVDGRRDFIVLLCGEVQ
jgi:SPP1 family predicted phage head-tail adaptor